MLERVFYHNMPWAVQMSCFLPCETENSADAKKKVAYMRRVKEQGSHALCFGFSQLS